MSDATAKPYELRPVKFSRLARRGVLMGLTTPQLIALGIAILTAVVTLYKWGFDALPWSAPIWLPAALVGLLRFAGRSAAEWVPILANWAIRRATGQTVHRVKLSKPRPAGTLALPGDAASLRQYEDPETGACLIHDPHELTLTAVLSVGQPDPAFVLLDPVEQERRVAAWGRALSTVCRSGRIKHIQVLERTLPDAGTGLADWWQQRGVQNDSWVSRTYADLVHRAGPAGERHATTISISLDMKAAARAIRTSGGGLKGTAAVLRQEMTTLDGALRTAELHPEGWLSAAEVAVMLRTAYDPAVSATLERAKVLGRDLSTAGPVAVEERWATIHTDSAWHAVLWISQWPQSLVYPGFLAPVLLTGGMRRAFTILYRPVRHDEAARDIRKKKVEHLSDAAQRAKIGQIDDIIHKAEYDDVLQQESELASGHGVLRDIGLIAISAATEDELEAALAKIEQAAVQASLETRRLVAQQAQAFAVAALPLARPA